MKIAIPDECLECTLFYNKKLVIIIFMFLYPCDEIKLKDSGCYMQAQFCK